MGKTYCCSIPYMIIKGLLLTSGSHTLLLVDFFIRNGVDFLYRMISRWSESKEQAITLRKSGFSINRIEAKLGIPRSTLSGWFKTVVITDGQKAQLQLNKEEAWARARLRAVESHRAQKNLRILEAKTQADITFKNLDVESPALLDLALAMLYLGEGSKSDVSSLASSDPIILRFVIAVLRKNYGADINKLTCELHLRADQDPQMIKAYWSGQLKIPIANFRHVAVDQRTVGRPTYDRYKGVCVLRCGSIAIQRKLISLYTIFCQSVIEEMGA
jgi:hypothetical protein